MFGPQGRRDHICSCWGPEQPWEELWRQELTWESAPDPRGSWGGRTARSTCVPSAGRCHGSQETREGDAGWW